MSAITPADGVCLDFCTATSMIAMHIDISSPRKRNKYPECFSRDFSALPRTVSKFMRQSRAPVAILRASSAGSDETVETIHFLRKVDGCSGPLNRLVGAAGLEPASRAYLARALAGYKPVALPIELRPRTMTLRHLRYSGRRFERETKHQQMIAAKAEFRQATIAVAMPTRRCVARFGKPLGFLSLAKFERRHTVSANQGLPIAPLLKPTVAPRGTLEKPAMGSSTFETQIPFLYTRLIALDHHPLLDTNPALNRWRLASSMASTVRLVDRQRLFLNPGRLTMTWSNVYRGVVWPHLNEPLIGALRLLVSGATAKTVTSGHENGALEALSQAAPDARRGGRRLRLRIPNEFNCDPSCTSSASAASFGLPT